jgi:Ca2+-binding RTX toxin-like protein
MLGLMPRTGKVGTVLRGRWRCADGTGVALAKVLVPALVLVFGMLATPSASAAVACSFDAGTGVASITFVDGDNVTIERSDDDIVVNGAACTGATVTTTDTIWILESGPGGEDLASLTIDMSGGPFAPGKTDEGDGSSEIEFLTGDQGGIDGDRMTLGSVTIVGTPGDDTILIGVIDDGGYSPIDLNGDEETIDWDIPGFGVDGADLDTPPAVDGGAGDDDLRAGGQVVGVAGSSLVLRGGDGDDTLVGGADFDDQIDGGAGTDTIVAEYESSIDLAAGTATSDLGDTDTLSSLENIIGSGGSDHLTGDEGPNRIEGGTVACCPDSNILGDVISGGGGDDELIGSEWLDTVDFSGATSGVVVDVPAGTATGEGNDTIEGFERIDGSAYDDRVVHGPDLWWIYAGDGTDTLDLSDAAGPVQYLMTSGLTVDGQHTSAEGFENVIGSPFADAITGTPGPNRMIGGRGADELEGWEGPDVLFGRRGADVLHGAEGRDELYGGRGNDLVSGDVGVDTCFGGPGHDVVRFCEVVKPPAK